MEELVVVCHVEKLLKMGNFMLIRALFYPFMKKGQYLLLGVQTPKVVQISFFLIL